MRSIERALAGGSDQGITPSGISRREFLTLCLPKLFLSVATTVDGIRGVAKGVTTKDGTFFPIYEFHSPGAGAEEIMRSLSKAEALFLESVGNKEDLPLVVLNWLPASVLAHLGQQKKPVIWGDVDLPPGWVEKEQERRRLCLPLYAGGILVFRGIKKREKLSRRLFLQVITAWFAWGLLSFPLSSLSEWEEEKKFPPQLVRMTNRLAALGLHQHPENFPATLLCRNLVWAIKMREIAEQKGWSMAYLVGQAHAGVEEYLRLGPDFCSWALTRPPLSKLVRELAEYNGRAFAETRLIWLPEWSAEKFEQARQGGSPLNEFWQSVKEEVVISPRLRKVLSSLGKN